ncbi:hypothetical protein PF005_g26611 [Phytophthora fragariae]|uniref:Uncharacterized protein n=2 Tax=Phytophthora fragariae TaxID=53985 RepID=A0A6A3DZB9_9STRA|nr:hypothetical protein PF003_g12721 [Phytophthora fragariae]KAE8924671.1 hypothetical protein PF009_g25098 [Phytophthora fragariae]KAE9172660.1 hypothetical protein PF005_g26611 [Phytophthora fragariae]KAE9272060.1 hypothetical protein PF001_g28100 [Phytophthora fragariae]
MREEDKNLAYLIKMMRKKYGRRDNMFRIQQRLAARVQQPGERLSDFATSLTSIGFGKRVPAESYVEAFINGIKIEITATQVRTYGPTTLDEAVQLAEYGEGLKVTDWRVAKRRHREEREYGAEDDTQPAKKKPPTTESVDQLDWKKLGLGFGGNEDTPPSFDTEGKAVSGLAKTAQKDPLSLAALRALMVVAGLGREETVGGIAASSKAKVARALEVKSEGGKQSTRRATRALAGRTRSADTAVVTTAVKAADMAVATQAAKAVAMPAAKAAAMPAAKAVATEATAADKPAVEAAVEETAMAAVSEDEEPAAGKASDVDAEADVGD